jgi:hypothetical protein
MKALRLGALLIAGAVVVFGAGVIVASSVGFLASPQLKTSEDDDGRAI